MSSVCNARISARVKKRRPLGLRVLRTWRRRCERLSRSYGLPQPPRTGTRDESQFGLIAQIASARDDALSELAQRTGLDQSTLPLNPQVLEAAGLVEIGPGERDAGRQASRAGGARLSHLAIARETQAGEAEQHHGPGRGLWNHRCRSARRCVERPLVGGDSVPTRSQSGSSAASRVQLCRSPRERVRCRR